MVSSLNSLSISIFVRFSRQHEFCGSKGGACPPVNDCLRPFHQASSQWQGAIHEQAKQTRKAISWSMTRQAVDIVFKLIISTIQNQKVRFSHRHRLLFLSQNHKAVPQYSINYSSKLHLELQSFIGLVVAWNGRECRCLVGERKVDKGRSAI